MNDQHLKEMGRDLSECVADMRSARTRPTPRPQILDEPVPEKESSKILFLAGRQRAAEEYAAALLAKDSRLLTPTESQFLLRETLRAAEAHQRGELE